jgi:hypothetical protein
VYRTRGRKGVSRLAIPVALIVVLVAAGAYVILTRSSTTSSQSSSASSLPTFPVSSSVNQLIQDLNKRNVDGVVTFYSANAVDVWSGYVGGLQGRYTGPENIRLLYATTIGKSTTVNANVSKYADHTLSPTMANTTFVITMLANSTVAGIVNATIDVSQGWNWGDGGWQISEENWAYAYYDSSYLDAGRNSSTTFPQWGDTLNGGNPNLVSEKSFEWHAGPYLAAALYAFLFGIVVVVAVKSRSKARGAGHSRVGRKSDGMETPRSESNTSASRGGPRRPRPSSRPSGSWPS